MCQTCEKTKEAIQEWMNQQGHNRCWYYPDIFKKLASLHSLEQTTPSNLPPLEEFKEGCTKYQSEEYAKPVCCGTGSVELIGPELPG